jgi:uncharacterized protein
MHPATRLFFIVLIACFPFAVRAQAAATDLDLIVNHVKEYDQKNTPAHSVHLQKSYNPVKAFLFLTMYFYQKVLSEQISAGCEFEVTCSVFSLVSIREFGPLKGICLSADRLTRCNGQAQVETQEYLINHSNGKTIDEPSMYRFKE